MKRSWIPVIALIAALGFIWSCGSSSSSEHPTISVDDYADFGKTLSDVVPAALKVGGANADIAAMMMKELEPGTCADSYEGCSPVTADGGGDSTTGEILMRLWSLDYNDECSAALIADGSCFTCVDCDAPEGNDFIIPTMLGDPTACYNTSTTAGRYVNLGIDPCFFDAMIAQIDNFDSCATTEGGPVSIASAVPWYASWEIPETVDFSSYSADDQGTMWWTINNGAAGDQQYFISVDENWIYGGIKDPTNDEFLFFGSGSPSYYEGLGEGSGVNISAYAGPLSTATTQFEAIQVRDQAPEVYIERLRSNGTHVWYQSWSGNAVPTTPAEVATKRDVPSDKRCLEIGTSIVTSRYVPFSDCVTSFGAADVAALNADSNYTLKVIDTQTAGSIQFTTPLTDNTTSACLTE